MTDGYAAEQLERQWRDEAQPAIEALLDKVTLLQPATARGKANVDAAVDTIARRSVLEAAWVSYNTVVDSKLELLLKAQARPASLLIHIKAVLDNNKFMPRDLQRRLRRITIDIEAENERINEMIIATKSERRSVRNSVFPVEGGEYIPDALLVEVVAATALADQHLITLACGVPRSERRDAIEALAKLIDVKERLAWRINQTILEFEITNRCGSIEHETAKRELVLVRCDVRKWRVHMLALESAE